MEASERTWCWGLLLVLGVFLHLPKLFYPRAVVFDEVTFGKYVNAYAGTHERIFDVHPPHGKLLMAGAARLGGYRGSFVFNHIGQPYDGVPIAALRLVPALAGVLLPCLLFLLVLQMGGGVASAFLAGCLLLFDNAWLVQTSFISMDGVLVSAIAGTMSAALAARRAAGGRRLVWRLLAGACAGLAVGSKFTGLIAPAVFVFLFGRDLLQGDRRRAVSELAAFVLGFATIYLGGWAIHFALLTEPGFGDQFYRPTGSFFTDLFELHRIMLTSNNGITASHPDGSMWWSWPFMRKPIVYWVSDGGERRVYLLGNPVVWWGTTAAVLLSALTWLRARSSKASPPLVGPPWSPWLLGAYAISLFPYVAVARVLFLYHYFPALAFAALGGSLWLEGAGLVEPGGLREQRATYFVALGLVLLGFLLVAPLTYGFPPWSLQRHLIACFL